MDSYLENAMDYVQEAFESANQWMKENDPLRFPEVEASVWDALDNDRGNDRGNDRNEGRDSSNSGLRDAIERATANDRGKMHDAFDRIDRGFNFLRDIIDRDERSGSHDESYKVLRNDLGLGSHAMDKNNVRYDILSDKAYVEKSWEDFNAQFKNNGENTQAGENFKQQEANIRRLEAGHHKILDYNAHIANIKAAAEKMEEQAEKERKERSVTDKIIDGFGQAFTRDENKDFSQDVNKVLDYTGKAIGFQKIVDDFGDDAKKVAKGAGDIFINTVDALGGAAQDLHDMQVGTDSSGMKVKKRDEL